MATPLLPFDEWVAGTLQNSVPANTNALRSEALAANVISDSTTAQPGSPVDGDCYIIPAGATGTQWATFAEGSLAYYRAGAWYEFTAYDGLLKVVAGEIKIYNGSAWEAYAGGGGGSNAPLSVEENGVEISADVTTINFTGSNVSATETSPGVVEVELAGGGGGGQNLLQQQAVRRATGNFPLFDMPESNISGNNIDENNYIFFPFTVWREIVATQLGVYVNNSGTGAVRVGIYANTFSGGNDQPGSRLVQTADIDTSGSSDTLRLSAASITLSPGTLYWAAFVKRGSASVAVRGSANPVLGREAFNGIITALSASASGWTELPSTAPSVSPVTFVGWRFHVFFRE